ncbi:Tetraspanin-2 [Zea mays]|uniref:Tetraspanin-2 n=1 Tax=Zea mays TaxID=4577 RepID=A0A1D6QCW8_MAIZE|nr:Tetraspanin-2 [Zea mays]
MGKLLTISPTDLLRTYVHADLKRDFQQSGSPRFEPNAPSHSWRVLAKLEHAVSALRVLLLGMVASCVKVAQQLCVTCKINMKRNGVFKSILLYYLYNYIKNLNMVSWLLY